MEFSVETESEANLIAQKTNVVFLVVLTLLSGLNTLGYFNLPCRQTLLAYLVVMVFSLPALVYGFVRHGQGALIRYLEIAVSLFCATMLIAFAGLDHSMAFLVPVILASVYLDRRFLYGTYVLVVLGMLIAALGNAIIGLPDANLVPFPEGQILAWRSDIETVCLEVGFDHGRYFRNLLQHCVFPHVVLTGMVVVLADGLIRIGRRRAEAAEAYSQGLLDTMGESPRRTKEKTKWCAVRTFAILLFAGSLPLFAEKIRIGFYPEKGFCSLNEKGERCGACVDWATAVAPINDWDIEWVNCTWKGGLDRLEKGEVDLMVAAVYRSSRRARWLFPHISLGPFRSYLFVRPGSPLAENVKTLEGARIGLPEEFVHADVLKAWLKRKNIACAFKVYATVAELERALAEGAVDAVLGSPNWNFAKEQAYLALPALPLYVAVNPRRPDLAEACDRAATILNEQAPGILARIQEKNLPKHEDIRPLHDISQDRDLSKAMSEVLAEGAAFDAEGRANAPRPPADSDTGPLVVVIVLLVILSVLGHLRLVRALAAAKSAARAKGNFLATMSHEIRTPLNAVVGFTELLDAPHVDVKARHEYLNGIKFASGALVALIDDVLDLSKLEAGRMDVLDGTVDPGRLLSEMESVFAFRTAEKGLDLQCSAASDIPRLALRESCIRQMLLNLIGNAVKFTDEGMIRCRMAAVPDGASTVTFLVLVRDTGCGIPAEKLSTLFDPFVQAADTVRDRVYRGTGLGLSIVKRLAEAAHGTLDVRSEFGRGTAFVLRIPHVKVLAPLSASTVITAPQAELPPVGQMSVLLVDDVSINLKVLRLHLQNLGIADVRTAESGAEALLLLRARPAHVVFTDLWMPGMTGEQLSREIRSDACLAGTRVVVVTADADAGASIDLSVFDATTTKPVTAAKLKTVLSNFLMPSPRN